MLRFILLMKNMYRCLYMDSPKMVSVGRWCVMNYDNEKKCELLIYYANRDNSF